jgi:hypothetical protein
MHPLFGNETLVEQKRTEVAHNLKVPKMALLSKRIRKGDLSKEAWLRVRSRPFLPFLIETDRLSISHSSTPLIAAGPSTLSQCHPPNPSSATASSPSALLSKPPTPNFFTSSSAQSSRQCSSSISTRACSRCRACLLSGFRSGPGICFSFVACRLPLFSILSSANSPSFYRPTRSSTSSTCGPASRFGPVPH